MRRLAGLLFLCTLLAMAAAPSALAFGLKDLAVSFEEEDGSPATQAGSHPFAMSTNLALNVEVIPDGAIDPETGEVVDGEFPEGQMKNLTITQARGLIGDQDAIPRCSDAQFLGGEGLHNKCPDEAVIGYAAAKAEFNAFPLGTEAFLHIPVYNLEPMPGAAAAFGFTPGGWPVVIDIVVSEDPPYNLIARVRRAPQSVLFYGSTVTLWGNPADPAHDKLRGKCIGSPLEPTSEPISNGSCPVSTSEEPLLTLPRSCKGPLTTVFGAVSWEEEIDEGFAETPGMTECDSLGFLPVATAKPTTTSASSPSGLDFSIEVDDQGLTDSEGRADADIAAVEVTLPAGMTANPAAAEGQGVCAEAQLASASLESRGCPEDSKLGTVTVASPLLEKSLKGSLYLAEPYANPFDSLLATYLVIRDEDLGIFVSQAGKITPNLLTGRLTTAFDDIPELPFADLNVSFREGPRAPLATPTACGTHTTSILLTPSSGNRPITSDSSFEITSGPGGGPCISGPPFNPGFLAGTNNNQAGFFSPFYMHFTRQDGEGEITRLDVTLPPGLVGKIAGVGRCSEEQIAQAKSKSGKAELASPSCPGDSKIGHVLAGSGVGPMPTQAEGALYLAGPFKGHPLSVVSVVPAVAGPFDLGTVVVRSALDLDPDTAQVRVIGADSDPIPTILRGIPLAVRDLRLYLDRPDFTLNATDCNSDQIRSTLSAGSLTAALTQHYQAQNCAALGFKPKLSLKLKGKTKRSGNPALKAVLTQKPGQANPAKAVVTLPRSEFLDQAHIRTICTRVQFAAKQCPKGSIYGHATAITPLLDGPLSGPVYLRSSDHQLPDLVVALKGPASAPIEIDLVGRIDSVHGGIRSTFSSVPDAPVSKFTLEMQGGKKGLIVNSRNLCSSVNRAHVNLTGQNGKFRHLRPIVRPDCKKSGRPKRGRGGK